MKQEYPTYLKSIGKSKALAATLSDTEPEDDSNNEDDEILNSFIATINLTKGIVEDVDEEEELVESKFEKMDDQNLRDSLVRAEEAMSFDRYQTECNLFLSVRIPPGRLLLLIGHKLDQNHS